MPLQPMTNSRLWAGRALSAIAAAILFADAGAHLFAPSFVRPLMEASGFDPAHATRLGLIILACATLYAIPNTAILGAILVTGFLGGAVCAHFRLGELASPPQIVAVSIGLLAWAGLYLRDPRLRAILPLRTTTADRGVERHGSGLVLREGPNT